MVASSPVFEALFEENRIRGKGDRVVIRLSYVDPHTLIAVGEYLYGKETPEQWNDIDLILSVLQFSSIFLMADLAVKCAEALLVVRDEDLDIEKVVAIIEAGRIFGFSCLGSRGNEWLQKCVR